MDWFHSVRLLRACLRAQPDFAADIKAKVASNPELYKLIESKIKEVRVRELQACFVPY